MSIFDAVSGKNKINLYFLYSRGKTYTTMEEDPRSFHLELGTRKINSPYHAQNAFILEQRLIFLWKANSHSHSR